MVGVVTCDARPISEEQHPPTSSEEVVVCQQSRKADDGRLMGYVPSVPVRFHNFSLLFLLVCEWLSDFNVRGTFLERFNLIFRCILSYFLDKRCVFTCRMGLTWSDSVCCSGPPPSTFLSCINSCSFSSRWKIDTRPNLRTSPVLRWDVKPHIHHTG